MKAILALVFYSASLPAQQASLEGLTVNAATQEPLPDVHVRLNAVGLGNVTASYGALSDREGHFSIATIRPGTYIFDCQRSGFLQAAPKESGGSIAGITLRPGQQAKALRIALAPRAILSGRVLDDHGDPVQGVAVRPSTVDEKDEPNIISPPLR